MSALAAIPASALLWEDVVPGGHHWSGLLRRGTALRLTGLDGSANVSALFFNHEERSERYCMPDTFKAQHTAFLTAGNVLMSDMGRVLCSVIGDDVGWHDSFCGLSDAELIREKYGEARYQTHRNAMHRNARDGLLIELGKWGLGKRDLVANANFFSKAVPDDDGVLRYVERHSRAGASVDLRFDMNVLVVLSTAPHPLAPAGAYAPSAVQLSAWRCGLAGADDRCRLHCPQNTRAFTNTERWFAQ